MKLRQNKLVPLRLQEHVALDVGGRERFEEILEALDSTRLAWIRQAPQTAHLSETAPSSSNRQNSKPSLGVTLAYLPQQTLGEYAQARESSLLSHVFRIAANFQNQTDRVIFVGDAQSQSVVKSILHAC